MGVLTTVTIISSSWLAGGDTEVGFLAIVQNLSASPRTILRAEGQPPGRRKSNEGTFHSGLTARWPAPPSNDA